MEKIGRNDPCPCGSGKKYKKCCLRKEEEKRRVHATPLPSLKGEEPSGDGSFLGDEGVFTEYRKLKSTDEKVDFVKNLFPLEDDFPTDLMIEIFSPLSNRLGSEGRHAEASELFYLFSQENRGIYEEASSVFDKMLMYHYVFLKDLEGIRVILDRFHSAPDQYIDDYAEVLHTLECYGYYKMALTSYQKTRKKIVSSRNIMGWGKDEFIEKLTALTLFEYVFGEEKTIKSPDDLFKNFQAYRQTDGGEKGHFRRILNILEGKERRKWTGEDFISGKTGNENLFYLSMEFVGWLKEKYGLQVLGLGENLRAETLGYLYGLGKKSLLTFSHKKMDEYLARLLRFPAFKQDKAMIALEGVKEFFTFLHQHGLTEADTVNEVRHSYDGLRKQVERILGEELWKYSWRKMLRPSDEGNEKVITQITANTP